MKKKLSLTEKIDVLVIYVGDKISWIYLFIVFISVYEVFMRYALNRPTVWVHETSLALAGMVMVYGGVYAYAKGKHINVPVVVDMLPQKTKIYFELFADIIGLCYIVLLGISTLMISSKAIFAPSGKFQLERSGSSWNSIFPGISKVSMSIVIILFIIIIAIHMISKILCLIDKIKRKKNARFE